MTSMDALLVLCICLYMNYFLRCFCICKTYVEEIKSIIIIIIIIIIIQSFFSLIRFYLYKEGFFP